MRFLSAPTVSGAIAASSLWAVSARTRAAADPLTIATLSSRAALVSSGDALVEIRSAAGASAKVSVTVNDRDVSAAFHADVGRKSLVCLVDGLRVGRNAIVAKAGFQTTRIEVTNSPITGPILSGEHLKPSGCNTVQSGLGEPFDADCSAKTKVEYCYKSSTPAAPAAGRGRGAAATFKPSSSCFPRQAHRPRPPRGGK
jgi:hypothetical protein